MENKVQNCITFFKADILYTKYDFVIEKGENTPNENAFQ